MYKLLTLIIAAMLCTSCLEQEPTPDYSTNTTYFINTSTGYTNSVFTCATYNIHLGFEAIKDPWNKNVLGADNIQIKNIANILRKSNANIIALQEVPLNRHNAIVKNFLEELAAEMDMNYAFRSHGYNDANAVSPVYGEWGNPILTKFIIEDIAAEQTEFLDQWERRSIINAKLKVDDNKSINVSSLHLLPSEKGLINTAEFSRTLSSPKIVMGDFNLTSRIGELNNAGLSAADSTNIIHVIDRVFIERKYFNVLELGTVKDSLGVSDHHANYAVIKLKD